MVKKAKKFGVLALALAVVLALLPAVTPGARAETEGNFAYSVSDGKATITKYNGNAADLIIPSTLGGHGVTSIGAHAFKGRKRLTGVTIPKSVKTIGAFAFAGCTKLTSVTIPKSVNYISNGDDDASSLSAFGACPVTITCYKDSYAHRYAVIRNIPFKLKGFKGLYIGAQPRYKSLTRKKTAALTVKAYGAGKLKYQWYSTESSEWYGDIDENSDEWRSYAEKRTGSGGTKIKGATKASYKPPATKKAQYYYCVVTDAKGRKAATWTTRGY